MLRAHSGKVFASCLLSLGTLCLSVARVCSFLLVLKARKSPLIPQANRAPIALRTPLSHSTLEFTVCRQTPSRAGTWPNSPGFPGRAFE